MDAVVVGQGYVGLPLAVRAAKVGHRVVGYDARPASPIGSHDDRLTSFTPKRSGNPGQAAWQIVDRAVLLVAQREPGHSEGRWRHPSRRILSLDSPAP